MKTTFPARLKYARQNAGLSTGQLAAVASLKAAELVLWEGGHGHPRSGEANAIADACDVSLEWLQFGTETTIPADTLKQLEGIPEKDRQALIALFHTLKG